MGIKRYYPMKIINHKPYSICTMTYASPIEAFNYAISRGVSSNDIIIKDIVYMDDSWNTEIHYSNIEDMI